MGTLYVNKLIPTSGGDVEVEGDVSGSGKTSIGQSLLVQDDANITGSLTVAGSITGGTFAHISGSSAVLGESLLVQQDVGITGSLTVAGSITGGTYTHISGSSAAFGQSILVHDDANITGSVNVGENVDIAGDIDVDGTTNLDNTDIDGTLVVDGSNISLDSTSTLNIDNSNTSNGITIGTATSGVPISIGHTNSVVTINDEVDITGTVDINDTTDASNSTSGALKVDGGVGVAKKLYVGTDLDVDGTANLDNTDIDGTLAVDGTTISLDATTSLNIDNSNTSNGITIGTATSGVPISIGHTTSQTTVNDNLTVTGQFSGSSGTFAQSLLVHDDANITGSVNVKGLTHAIGGLGVTGSAVHTVSSDLPMTASLLYNTSNDPDAQVKFVIQNDQHNKLVLGKGSSTFIDSSTGNGDVKFNLSTITSTSGALLIRTDGGGDVQASGYGTYRDSIWLHQTTGDYMPNGGLVIHNQNKVTVGQNFHQDSYDFQSSGKVTAAFNVLGNARVTGSLTVDGHVSGSSAAFGQSVLVHDDISVTGSIFTAIGIAAGTDGGDLTFKQYDGVESARVVDGNEYAVLTVGASTINHLSGAARGGFSYKMPVAQVKNSGSYTYNHIDHPAGARRVPLDASMSGYLIKVNGNDASNDMEIILPSSGSIRQLDGVHFKIITTEALHSSANLFIRHPNPSSATAFIANIVSVSGTVGGSYSGYATDKKLKVAQNCPAGVVIDLTCIDGGTQNGGYETWLIEAKSAGNFITLEDE